MLTFISLAFAPSAKASQTAQDRSEQSVAGSNIYATTFSGNAGPEWSPRTVATTPSGERFLGPFSNDSATLTLKGLVKGASVTVRFDLYVIKTWDGNADGCPGTCGPDYWDLAVNGNKLIHTTFSNNNGSCSFEHQSYPGNYLTVNEPRTGARSNDTLGYGTQCYGDSIYRINRTVTLTGDTLTVRFTGSHLQGVGDESWGIDNVKVLYRPCTSWQRWAAYPTAPTKYSAGAAGGVTLSPGAGNTLQVTNVSPSPGWSASIHHGTGTSIEVAFSNGPRRATFDADVEDSAIRIAVVIC